MVTQSKKNEGNSKHLTSITTHQKKRRHKAGHVYYQQHHWEQHILRLVFLSGKLN